MTACSRHEDVSESNLSRAASRNHHQSQRFGWLHLALLACITGAGFAQANEAFISDDQPGCLATAAGDGICVTDQIPRPLDEGRGVLQELFAPGCSECWVGQVDALMLWQGNIQSQPLFLNQAGGVALNANQAQPPMSAGPRFGLARRLTECDWIEGNYFRVDSFAGRAVLPAGASSYSTINLADLSFDDIQSASLATSGRIQSAELNVRSCEGGLITWIGGFRWVEWNQQANVDYAFLNPDPFGSGNVASQTGNNLYGGQLGAELPLWDAGSRLKIKGIGKSGVFYNRAAYQHSTTEFVTSTGEVFPQGSVAAAADQTAFVGEVGANASLCVTSWLTWRAGYTLFWLSGVAVPASQLPVTSFGDRTALVNTQGSVLLHGVTTGLEARW